MRLFPSARRLALSLAGMYAAFATGLYLYADRLIFLPHAAGYALRRPYQAIPGPDRRPLAALWLPRPGAPYTILYSHGNAEDLGDVAPTLRALHALGYAVLGYDYPGYGRSPGVPTEATTTAAARMAYDHLVKDLHVPPDRIVLHGRSVGGGPTVALAGQVPARALILESTFTGVQAVRFPVRILPFDEFPSERTLARLELPVLVIHGKEDALIPVAHGEALYAAARGRKAALWVEGAGHDDVQDHAGPRWGAAIGAFLGGLG